MKSRALMSQRSNVLRWAAVGWSVVLCACQPTAMDAVAVIDPESPGAKVMVKYCSDCHAPPRPASHVADEWPGVVHRMQEARRMKGYSLLSEHETEALVTYLQKHAKG